MERLAQKGFISEPRGKAKSVVFSEEGLARAREVFATMFGAEVSCQRRA